MPNKSFLPRRIAAPVLGAAILFAAGLFGHAGAHAQTATHPTWQDLTPAQRTALAPMQGEWDSLDAVRKRKWIEFAAKYDRMKPDEQARMQERMRGWSLLSPEARQKARDNYKQARNVPPEKRQRAWEEYQNLTPEERQRLEQETRDRHAKTAKAGAKRAAPANGAPPAKAQPPVSKSGS